MNNYYEENYKSYIENTLNIDMNNQYELFLKYMSKKGKILDIGFGSGRDIVFFTKKGYEVKGIDITSSFVNNMKNKGYDVELLDVNNMSFENEFDGIWACASLLHIKRDSLKEVLMLCYKALKKEGYMYCSFKYGDYDGYIEERYYNNVNEDIFNGLIENTGLRVVETSITVDLLNRDNKWINFVLTKD